MYKTNYNRAPVWHYHTVAGRAWIEIVKSDYMVSSQNCRVVSRRYVGGEGSQQTVNLRKMP